MTTDLATYEQPSGIVRVGAIQQTARDLDDAYKIAGALVVTQFAPAHFRGKPQEAAAAILYGQTINMDPLTSLQNIYSIGNKPALYARAMVAVVLSQGHEVWTVEEGPETVTVSGRRRGSQHVETVTWTTARAQQAGYTKNAKYHEEPQAMLYARASGDVARRVAPDALLGMSFTAEELMMQPQESAPVTVKLPGLAGLRAAVTPTNDGGAPPPEAEGSPVEDTADAPPSPLTGKTRGRMFALFAQKGIGDAEQLPGINHVLKTEYTSRSQMTEEDAFFVIDHLHGLPDAEADAADDATLPGVES